MTGDFIEWTQTPRERSELGGEVPDSDGDQNQKEEEGLDGKALSNVIPFLLPFTSYFDQGHGIESGLEWPGR